MAASATLRVVDRGAAASPCRHETSRPGRGGMVLSLPERQSVAQRLEATFVGRCLRAFIELQGVDRAMAIAAQAFTALIPLLLLVSTLAPADNPSMVAEALVRRFGLAGSAAASVREVFAHSGDGGVGLLSALLLFFSGVSLTRRLQRLYRLTWRLDGGGGVRDSLNAALGLSFLVVEIALLSLVRTVVRGMPYDGVLGFTVSASAGVALWTTVPWLLLDRRLRWRRLLPYGVIAAVCANLYGLATTVYMPRLIVTYSERYGLFGVTLALVGWLLCMSITLVAAAVVASELDRAPQRWARPLQAWVRREPRPTRPQAEAAECPTAASSTRPHDGH